MGAALILSQPKHSTLGAPTAMADPLIPKDRIPWRHLVLFGWLPSPLKILAYRQFLGYRIGRGVRFSFGGIVVGKSVDIGDYVEIGFLAVVQGRSIRIGRYSSVGTMSYVSCETIEMGEDAKIREQVYVGGPQLPESRFALGSRTIRSEEHTSELQSPYDLVCRLLLEKKKKKKITTKTYSTHTSHKSST